MELMLILMGVLVFLAVSDIYIQLWSVTILLGRESRLKPDGEKFIIRFPSYYPILHIRIPSKKQ